ncbi:MAG: YlxM family DNA-binding protein, partial [Anaerovoracaceae bacterium]
DIYCHGEVNSMKIDDITKASLLYDFYGGLLTERQREVLRLYHEENLSLAEIGGEFSISRQAVHDALKNAEKALNQYEETLGLVSEFKKSNDAVNEIDIIIDDMVGYLENNKDKYDKSFVEKLYRIRDIIDKLEE